MSFFPDRSSFRHFAVFAFVFALAGCGIADAVGDATGKAIGEGLGKAMGCALSAGFSSLGGTVAVGMEQSQYDDLGNFIRKNGIGDENALFAKVDANSAAFLRRQIAESYAQLAADSALRAKPVEFYQALYGYGLVQAAKENLPLGKVSFYHAFGTNKNGTTEWKSFGITLTIEHARGTQSKGYARCE